MKCAIVYDVLEQGAGRIIMILIQRNMRDPTRCGMPINPLLKESSYGCKVNCSYNTTYEMKIKIY